jgi:hypothetical protein
MSTNIGFTHRSWRQAVLTVVALTLLVVAVTDVEGVIIGKRKKEPMPRPVVQEPGPDGLNLTALDDVVSFDLDAANGAELVTWTKRSLETGFFWLDLDNDGEVDSGSELFGNATSTSQGPARDGFAALAQYDLPEQGGTRDGTLSRQDQIWPALRFWVDWNHDGRASADEVSTMADLHIEAIDLLSQPLNLADPNGNYVLAYAVAHGEEGQDDFWVFDVLLQRAH